MIKSEGSWFNLQEFSLGNAKLFNPKCFQLRYSNCANWYHLKCQYFICYFVPAVMLSAQVSHFLKYLISGEHFVSNLFVLFCVYCKHTSHNSRALRSVSGSELSASHSTCWHPETWQIKSTWFKLVVLWQRWHFRQRALLHREIPAVSWAFSHSLCWQEKPAWESFFFFFNCPNPAGSLSPNPADDRKLDRAYQECLCFISVWQIVSCVYVL